jgi:hypothetical protein
MTPELASQVELWRMKIADKTITKEEMRQAVIHLRQGRLMAASSSAAAKKKVSKAIPNADDLLADMEE